MSESVVGPWAKDKLKLLGKYLHAYTQIMKDQKWCEGYYYIDAFAGPGYHNVRKNLKSEDLSQLLLKDMIESDADSEEFIMGSPRVALELENPFSAYFFVERSAKRCALLENLKTNYGDKRKIGIRNQDCAKYLINTVAKTSKINWKSNRAFIFLDPYGMQIGWDVLKVLADTHAVDIFLNFGLGMSIQRLLLLRRPENFKPLQRKFLDQYFGTSEWFDVIYKRQTNLFGENEQTKVENSGKVLLSWYRKRLQSIFRFVSKGALIRNTRGGHLYYLILASDNQTGVKIANQILSKTETDS